MFLPAAISASASSSLQMRNRREAPPRPRQIGQALQRVARAAEMIDQRTEGARPDVVGTDQRSQSMRCSS